MDKQISIFKYKHKLLIFLAAFLISITALQPKMTVYADDLVGVILDALGYDGSGATTEIKNGVTYARTGYLCYLVKAEGGNIPGMQAYAFYSAINTADLPGSKWQCTSKAVPTGGTYTASGWKAVAPWQVTPFNIDKSTNVEQIRAYLTKGMTGNRNNGVQFVYDNWGEEVATHFYNGEYVLVIETILNFQFSNKTNDVGTIQITRAQAIAILTAKYGEDFVKAMQGATLDGLVISVNAELARNSGGGWKTVGTPLIGTCADFIDYYHELEAGGYVKSNYFALYTNKVAPFAEMIHQGEAGEKAGFIPWTGGTSSEVPDSVVPNYGVAVMVLKATADAQTTCDEPLIPTPHNPPKESQGHTTIVKSYRTKDPTGKLIDDGTFHLKDLGTQILIENEQTYQVIGWKTSTTTNTGIKSTSWNPPSSVVQQGTAPKSVTLQPTETCLYVLLEKVEEEEVEPLDWNYRLTESSITRTVWFSNPDNPLTNMNGKYKIDTKPFRWMAMNHVKCNKHDYQGPCSGHEQDCDCSGVCKSPCDIKATNPAHVCTKCTADHTKWCQDKNNCEHNTLYATCGHEGWQWIDKSLNLSINNTLQKSYPDILATKEGWNEETKKDGIVKYHHTGGEVERDVIDADEYFPDSGAGETGWDYVCILMRGKDKLTLAEWQNYGQGNNGGNA